jgi:hypothetical protein
MSENYKVIGSISVVGTYDIEKGKLDHVHKIIKDDLELAVKEQDQLQEEILKEGKLTPTIKQDYYLEVSDKTGLLQLTLMPKITLEFQEVE